MPFRPLSPRISGQGFALGGGLALLAILSVLFLPASGCLRPYCEDDADCAQGQRCNLDRHRCHVVAGDDGGLPDASDAGDASTGCTLGSCENPAPICDATSLDCRGCEGDPECASLGTDRPWCDDGTCVACFDSLLHCGDVTPICDATSIECRGCEGDPECVDLGSDEPWCVGGACVACVDSASHCLFIDESVCDPVTHACRSCESHDECEHLGGICDGGTCLLESQVLYVDDDATCQGADGTRGLPYCQITNALAVIWYGRRVIHVADGTYAPIIIRNKNVWIVARGNAVAVDATDAGSEAVWVTLGVSGEVTTAILEGLTIQGAGSPYAGVYCNTSVTGEAPTLTLQGCTVTANDSNGILISACAMNLVRNHIHANDMGLQLFTQSLTMDANRVEGNLSGGILLGPGSGTITNNLIAGNGFSGSSVGGIFIPGTAGTILIQFNTIAGNESSEFSKAPGVACNNPICPGIELSSNIFWNPVSPARPDVSAEFTPTYSFIRTGDLGVGLGNINGDPAFVDEVDYRLSAWSPCRGAGAPDLSVTSDRDGQARPQPAGSTPDIGADEVL